MNKSRDHEIRICLLTRQTCRHQRHSSLADQADNEANSMARAPPKAMKVQERNQDRHDAMQIQTRMG